MFTAAELLDALKPGLGNVPGAADVVVRGVCTDSRQAGEASLFVALKGERADGHDYVGQAFAAGAVAALVERPVTGRPTVDVVRGVTPAGLSAPVEVVVPDALAALQALAGARRAARPDLLVVGVTGSVGKTTTKEAVAAVLSEAMATLKSEGTTTTRSACPSHWPAWRRTIGARCSRWGCMLSARSRRCAPSPARRSA